MNYHLKIFKKVIPIVVFIAAVSACIHDPFPGPAESGVSNGNGEPVNTDTVRFQVNTASCDESTIYFNNQVLPIFISNCAISGCHDVSSAREGVVLTNYQTIMKGIKSGSLNDSKNYKVLITSNSEDLMPRKPGTERGYSLPQDQIDLIKKWILQGAKNTYCDACDTTNYFFSSSILSIMELNCATSIACHGTGSKNGVLTTYDNIKAFVNTSQIQRRVIINKDMPPASPISDCDRLLIKKWIDDGAQNN